MYYDDADYHHYCVIMASKESYKTVADLIAAVEKAVRCDGSFWKENLPGYVMAYFNVHKQKPWAREELLAFALEELVSRDLESDDTHFVVKLHADSYDIPHDFKNRIIA